MKTRNKIIIPAISLLAIGLFYLLITASGFPFYNEGIVLHLYSDYKLQEFLNYPENRDFPITKITDNDLNDVPELKKLIEKALSKEYPLNEVGRVPITLEELYNFQQQYSEILAEKYSKNSTDFFTTNDKYMPEEYLAIDPTVHLRTLEAHFFEYDDKPYGIGPNSFYIPFMEDGDLTRLEVYKINESLQEMDLAWADLSEKQIDLKPLIIAAIDNIGQQQENIEVQTFGLPPATMIKYENWKANTLEGSLFEYEGKVFSIGFWIA
jgi:hypothetical protein